METPTLVILARILAKPEKRDLVLAELQKLVEPTRAEKGCISYVLHQDTENINQFFFVENWENYDIWQVHMKNDMLAAYLKATEGCVDEFVIHQLNKI